ncbi:MAG: MmcQ/YjbR family DNA-binding protein [Phascolarctobacterium sp.]|nr:MmcQ/YjbR family DNA-binding protein [Phascolarctobacterium sp.]
MLYPLLEQYDIDCKRAIAYGFSRTEAGLELKKELPGVGLYAVFVIAGKSFEVNVFDADTDEEYLPFNVLDNVTGFVTGIREQVEDLVQEIKEKCLLNSNMKLRLMEYCERKFGTEPEAPWEDSPDAYTFKTAKRNKWYALFMTIPYKSLGLAAKGTLDVVNIKLPPEKVLDLIDRVHFYPAYHMNKKHWITIVLDKEADEPLVQQLLEESYGLVDKL